MTAQGTRCCIEALYLLGSSFWKLQSEGTGYPHPFFQEEDPVSNSHKFHFDGRLHRTVGSQSWGQNRHGSDRDTRTWGHMEGYRYFGSLTPHGPGLDNL